MNVEQLETIKNALETAKGFVQDEIQYVIIDDLKADYQEIIDELETALALFD